MCIGRIYYRIHMHGIVASVDVCARAHIVMNLYLFAFFYTLRRVSSSVRLFCFSKEYVVCVAREDEEKRP